MKPIGAYRAYIAALLAWFAIPYIADLLDVSLKNQMYAVVLCLACGFVADKIK